LKLDGTAANAKFLLDIFKDYGIKRGMQLDRLTGLFANLIGDLEGKAAAAIQALGLQDLVKNIKQSQEELRQLSKERLDEANADGIARLKKARAKADKAYHDFTDMVEALALLGGDAAYTDFIDRANTEIKHYKQEVLGQKVTDKKPGNEDNPDQNGGDDDDDVPQG
ncbi:MAG: DUF6261 family protein, partial [Prevotellaceae bacterium]|nr:DUF6261 family protein [Prevotellaceae bacterium]